MHVHSSFHSIPPSLSFGRRSEQTCLHARNLLQLATPTAVLSSRAAIALKSSARAGVCSRSQSLLHVQLSTLSTVRVCVGESVHALSSSERRRYKDHSAPLDSSYETESSGNLLSLLLLLLLFFCCFIFLNQLLWKN